MRTASFLAALVVLSAAFEAHAGPGFVRVEERDGRWWFIDAKDKPFFSTGVDNVSIAPDIVRGTQVSPYRDACQKKFGSEDAWRQAAATQMLDLGFNSLGAWSDPKVSAAAGDGRALYFAPTVDLGSGFVGKQNTQNAWLTGRFPNVFDPAFSDYCRAAAAQRCAPQRDEPHLLGWFTDNELSWGADWRNRDPMLVRFVNEPETSPGRQAALEVLRGRYPDVAGFNAVWKTHFAAWAGVKGRITNPYPAEGQAKQNDNGALQAGAEAGDARKQFLEDCDAFQGKLADRYFQVTAEAIRAADPNHLVLGCRFANNPGEATVRAAARHVDVISFNNYGGTPRDAIRAYAAAGRPVLIGEFAFRGDDVGLANTKGAGPRVASQTARAAAFRIYATRAAAEPALVGYHWFEHSDEPAAGRFDGENSNYGIVNIRDEPYEELDAAMKEVNGQAEALHRGGQAAGGK